MASKSGEEVKGVSINGQMEPIVLRYHLRVIAKVFQQPRSANVKSG